MCLMCLCILFTGTGKYIDVSGQSFRDFLRGELPGYPGQKTNHAGLGRSYEHPFFPKFVLKKFLEVARRGWRYGGQDLCLARPVGPVCSMTRTSLDAAWDLVKDWTAEGPLNICGPMCRLRHWQTKFRQGTVLGVAQSDGLPCRQTGYGGGRA